MLRRWGIRLASSLIGIAVGMILSVALLDGFSASTTAIFWATILFWIVHIIVSFIALRILIRQPSLAMAGLLALLSTVVALIVVNLIVSDLSVSGIAYVWAALIIWICTAIADVIGGRMIREQRRERRD